MQPAIPVLRSFDETLMRAFYLDFLGFTLDWEHRHSAEAPLYCQLSQGSCLLHLSEHFGDATPGSAVRIETARLADWMRELREKKFAHCNPGEPELQPWGLREITLTDPFGNRLTFYEPGQ